MSRLDLRSTAVAATAVLLVSSTGCPTISIRSLDVTKFSRNVVTLVATIDVDNSADDAGSASSSFAVALDPDWVIQDVRYDIPGEPLQRRARTAPGVAALTDWAYTTDSVTWWGFRSAEHVVPAGLATYTVTFTIAVPRGTKAGSAILMVGDPGPDAVVGAFDLTFKPRSASVAALPPEINPASQVQMDMANQDMSAALGGFGEGFGETFGEGFGEAGDALQGLGAMLGLLQGADGYRSPWVEHNTVDGTLRAGGVAVDLPADCSAIAEEPTGDTIELVLLPPGATFPSVLVIKPAASEAEALKMVEHEMTLTRDDMGSDAVVVTNVSWETSGGLNLAGKDFAVVEDGASVHTVITHRYEAGTLVIAVVNAGEDNIEQARKFLGTVLDATHFEP